MNVPKEKRKPGRPHKDPRKKRDKRVYFQVSDVDLDFLEGKAGGRESEHITALVRKSLGLQ